MHKRLQTLPMLIMHYYFYRKKTS